MMLATHSAIKVATRTDVDDDALDRLMNDGPEPPVSFFSDESFGTAAECAADALFVKRLSLNRRACRVAALPADAGSGVAHRLARRKCACMHAYVPSYRARCPRDVPARGLEHTAKA